MLCCVNIASCIKFSIKGHAIILKIMEFIIIMQPLMKKKRDWIKVKREDLSGCVSAEASGGDPLSGSRPTSFGLAQETLRDVTHRAE